ncbi:hypothetical protein HPP92_023576 [Vanilla planifolia]|uniref:Xanthine dehydrogenase n=1 Tax=Vanilla planifolia TaxID=51239 RepID=A0A835PRR1_VANPL|nr:hypothetical protein HPP92_023576 [Vanilla planifolia]
MGSLTHEGELEAVAFAAEAWSSEAILYVNGVRRVLPDGLAHITLLQYLRDVGLTGTKLGCGEGGCGACTVMVSDYDRSAKKSVHYAVNACLAPLYSVEGMHVITVEGLGCYQSGLHPVQESLAQAHGSQCGFCTPGFLMSMYALLRSNKIPPSEEQIEECLSGNLCRCTGYRPIIDSFRVFAKSDNSLYIKSSNTPSGEFVCPTTGKPCSCGGREVHSNGSLTDNATFSRCGPVSHSDTDGSFYIEKELIFPPELLLRNNLPLKLHGFGGINWYRPLRLEHLLHLKSLYPEAKLVVGNTEVGIEINFKNAQYPIIISTTHVPELNVLSVKDNGIEIGSSVRLSKLQEFLKKLVAERDVQETSSCRAISDQLKWFAGKQVKNVASVGGNICTASPISDLNPIWIAARAEFLIVNFMGNIRKVHAKEFFIGYRKIDLAQGEILHSIFVPWSKRFEFVKEFKQSHRREDDIALVNAGMRVHLKDEDSNWKVSDVSIVYGGVAPVPLIAARTETFLVGKIWDKKLLLEAIKVLKDNVPLAENAPGGMVEFRKSLTLSFFFKFFLWVTQKMNENGCFKEVLDDTHLSAIQANHRSCSSASQRYEILERGTAVGLPMVHQSARLQVSGMAEYTDDTPTPPNTLHAVLVLSKKANARILSIDDTLARTSPGFAGLFLAKDVPGSNKIGAVVHDEEVFATDMVTCVGQVIGIVVADTHDNAKAASKKVHIEYEELPPILSISDAIRSGSFYPDSEKCLIKGDVEWCFQSGLCDRVVEGEVQIGGQEHFYLEPHASLIWTVDGGNEVHMISSTQAPQKHQVTVARVLGIPFSKVVCKTKRIGGGFGGKETRSAFIAAAACVPSYILKRPVKITLDRDVDMMITGQRHSFLGKYKVGFTNAGKILALDIELYNNAGNSLDLSSSILERALFHSDNVYSIPHIRVSGKVCFTNLPSNTAFRGFGGPQGMLIAENWIHHVSMELHRSPEDIRAGALVQVYTDGSVLVTHGGVEMGQGLHTKVAQIAASSFSIPLSSVFISETCTDKVPNASPTAASASSDMYGAAVLDACEQIKARMKPIAATMPHASFAEVVRACHLDRIDLSAHGFYITPDIGFDWKVGKGRPFSYHTYGAAFAEVEIDTLTGDFYTRTANVIMDLGYSLNPAIDIGQIEGAFVQGMGWVALEELKWGDADHKWIRTGNLFTCGPGTYKIPTLNDIPLNFHVSLLKGVPNPKAIHSSKAVGEPPFFLASAVLFAIKDAIIAARAEEGLHDWFPLDSPATPERIRMACVDDFTREFAASDYRPKISI